MRIAILTLLVAAVSAFAPFPSSTRTSSFLAAAISRKDFITSGLVAAAGAAVLVPGAALADETLPNGVIIKVNKSGKGPKAVVGDLVAIRFRASVEGGQQIDDIFDTPEPYYTRIGAGALIKGVEDALPMMRVGDNWTLTIPSNLAFGSAGRKASAGKPRISGDATVIFEVEMVGLPGKEEELIEVIGDV